MCLISRYKMRSCCRNDVCCWTSVWFRSAIWNNEVQNLMASDQANLKLRQFPVYRSGARLLFRNTQEMQFNRHKYFKKRYLRQYPSVWMCGVLTILTQKMIDILAGTASVHRAQLPNQFAGACERHRTAPEAATLLWMVPVRQRIASWQELQCYSSASVVNKTLHDGSLRWSQTAVRYSQYIGYTPMPLIIAVIHNVQILDVHLTILLFTARAMLARY